AIIREFHPGVASVGIAWPRTALEAPARAAKISAQAHKALKASGARLDVQMVRGPVSVADSPAILALARQTGATLDVTVLARGEPGPSLHSYQDLSSYRPAEFDMRLISRSDTELSPI